MHSDTFLVAVISPNREIPEALATALEDDRQLESFWTLADYPDPRQIQELLACRAGCVVFLDFTDSFRATQVAAQLTDHPAKAVVIGIQPPGTDSAHLLELMRLGVQDALPCPLAPRDAQLPQHVRTQPLNPEDFRNGHWREAIEALRSQPNPANPIPATGAAHCAARILNL